MLLDDPIVSITPESLGLTAVRPQTDQLQPFEVDFFEGRLPPGPKCSFFIHATEDRHLEEVHPISRGVVEKNRKTLAMRQRHGKESYRASWVKTDDYRQVAEILTAAAGTAVVNAHVVTSKLTGVTSYGVYQALLLFPESLVDRAYISAVQAMITDLALGVRSLGDLSDDWFYGLGALTGIRPYTNYFAGQEQFPFTNGNAFTGCMVAEGIRRLAQAWVERRKSHPSVGIVGATGSTGMVTIANIVDWLGGSLTIAAREPKALATLAERLPRSHLKLSIVAGDTAAETVAQTCDLVVYLVSDPTLKVDPRAYRPNAIIYDPSRPRLHSNEDFADRPDVRLLDGPSVHIPGSVLRPSLNNYDGNEVLSCMAQTAYHAVSGDREFLMPPLRVNQFDCHDIQHQSILLMARARAHGFTITPWERWLSRKFSIDEIFER